MKKKELTYKQKVFEHLDRLPACVKNLNNLKDKEAFIKVLKEYIDQGVVNRYVTELSEDYTKFKRFDVILRTSADKLKESLKKKLYNTPILKETMATHETPIKLKRYGMLLCGFCGHLCSEFDDDCGNCRQILTFKYDYGRTNESGREDYCDPL